MTDETEEAFLDISGNAFASTQLYSRQYSASNDLSSAMYSIYEAKVVTRR